MEPKYNIVERCPTVEKSVYRQRKQSKWIDLFEKLPDNKAIEIPVDSRVAAKNLSISVTAAIRHANLGFRVRSRLINEGSRFTVYFWKERKADEQSKETP